MRRALAVVLVVLTAPTAAPAATDPAGDVEDPDLDLVAVALRETATALELDVTVAGALPSPDGSIRNVAASFRIVPGELDDAPSTAGARIALGPTNVGTYGVFRHVGVGHELPVQPAIGVSSATWTIPKAYLDAHAGRRPLAGDRVTDVVVSTESLMLPVDEVELPDLMLAKEPGAAGRMHLRAGGAISAEPSGGPPAVAAAFAGRTAPATFRSAPLDAPRPVAGLAAVLWLAATTSTHALAVEVVRLDVYAEDPSGARTLVAVREESRSAVGTENVYLAPGVPQRMPFRLAPTGAAASFAEGERVVLVVRTGGFLVDESGPVAVLHDDPAFDSFLAWD